MTGVGGAAAAASLVVLTLVLARAAVRERRRARAFCARFGAVSAPGRSRIVPVPGWLARSLAAAGVAAEPTRVVGAWLAATGVGVALMLLAGGGAAALLLASAVGAPLGWLRLNRERAAARYEAALPGGLEAVARALRAGASLLQALASAADASPGPVGADLRRVVAGARAGEGVVGALEGWGRRRALPGVRLATAALCLGVETGGAQARAVDGVAQTLRQRLDVAAEVRALSSQARASALVIALAPVGFGAVALGVDRPTASFALRTPLGLAMLAAGLALDAVGAAWMARLARVRPPALGRRADAAGHPSGRARPPARWSSAPEPLGTRPCRP